MKTILLSLLLCSAACAQSTVPVTLAWDRNPEFDVIGYKVILDTPRSFQCQMIDVLLDTKVTLYLKPGNVYYATVHAYNWGGTIGYPSNQMAFTVNAPLRDRLRYWPLPYWPPTKLEVEK